MQEAYANLRTGEAFTELFECTKHSKNGDIVAIRPVEGKVILKKLVPSNVGLWIDDVTSQEVAKAYQKGLIHMGFLQ